jgi:pimeloyl-ACP methyl ester carboxylesterase
LLLAACSGEDIGQYTVPFGEPALLYAPFEEVLAFPDDLHTLEDPQSLTGRRVLFQDDAAEVLRGQMPEGFNLVQALETLDGWGTAGALFLHFSEPVDPGSFTPETVHLIAMNAEGTELPWEVTWEDEGTAAFIVPLLPLVPATRHALVIEGLTNLDGDRFWASQDLGQALEGTHSDVRMRQHAPALLQALDQTGVSTHDAVAVLVFTTQSLYEQDRAVMAWLDENPGQVSLVAGEPCVEDSGIIETCPAMLTVRAFVDEDRVFTFGPGESAVPGATWTLAVDVHLPLERVAGPLPVVIYGHGLGGDRGESRGLARDLAPLGIAVVALDAPAHGEHPTTTTTTDFFWIFQFFGIDPATQAFDVFQLRNNWRVAAHDKLQLTAAIRSGFDADQDGQVDLDGTRVLYAGHSLGGIMGAQLLALDRDLLGADLSVPGGRVSEIVHRSETFSMLIALMSPAGTSEGDVTRFFAMLQAAMERGDAVNWAGQVLDGNRDVLLTMVIDDDVIPNATTRALARAFGVEHVGPVLQEVPGLAVGGGLPVSGNLDGRTAVFYQYEFKVEDDTLKTADHFDAHSNDAAVVQFQHFWQTHLEDDLAELIDPFEALGY